MILSAIPLLLASIIASFLPEPKKTDHEISEKSRYKDLLLSGLTALKKRSELRILLLNSLGVSTAAYFVIWFYQPLLTKVHIPVFYFGLFHAGLVLTEIVVASQFKRIIKIFRSPANALLFGAIVTSLTIIISSVFPSVYTVILMLIFAGGFGLTRLDLIASHTHKYIRSNDRASVASSLSMFRRFAQAIFNPIIGLLADKSLVGAIFITGLLPLISVFLHSRTKTLVNRD
jgi:hypothetical protein